MKTLDDTNINITDTITSTINSILNNLFSSIDNNIYSVLDNITFIDTSILKDGYFDKIFGVSSSYGILLIANSLLIGFVLYYAIRLILSHFAIVEVQSPWIFIVKTIFFGICMNCSFFLCEQLIFFNSLISASIAEIGQTILDKEVSFSSLISQVNSFVYVDSSLDLFSFAGIIKSLISFSLFNLLFSYALRFVMVKVFVLISPFAFLSLCNISTSWFFKTWFKNFISFLLFQSFIALILLVLFSLDFNNSDAFSQLVYVGGIYSLIKANDYMKVLFNGLGTQVSTGMSNLSLINRR